MARRHRPPDAARVAGRRGRGRRPGGHPGRQRHLGPDRGLRRGPAHQGRDGGGDVRPGAGHARPRRAGGGGRGPGPGRHVRDGRRPQPLHQRVDHRRSGRGRRRRQGVQARQPGRILGHRLGRPAGGARGGHRPRACGRGPVRGRGGHGVLLRSPLPRRLPSRRPHQAGPGRPHRVQLPGTAGQPGPAPPPGGGGERSGHGRDDAGRAGGQRRGPGHGRARARRHGRAHHHHDLDGVGHDGGRLRPQAHLRGRPGRAGPEQRRARPAAGCGP